MRVRKSAQRDQEFVSYWYAYLQTSEIFTTIFDAFKSK